MVYCFDIDGTICTQEEDYSKAKPYRDRIDRINRLYHEGHTILFLSARGSTTGIDWEVVTRQQLREWKVAYHRLILGKPQADCYIDDKGVSADVFFGR